MSVAVLKAVSLKTGSFGLGSRQLTSSGSRAADLTLAQSAGVGGMSVGPLTVPTTLVTELLVNKDGVVTEDKLRDPAVVNATVAQSTVAPSIVTEQGAIQSTTAASSVITEEALLVARTREGDMTAFRELVERYQNRVKSLALGLLGNQADAEDVIQDAFLKAYRNLGSFRGDSSFYTWLYRIVFNLCLDLGRKKTRRSENQLQDAKALDTALHTSSMPGFLGSSDLPEQHIGNMELRNKITEAINGLSPEHRAVIILREVDGLSYEEMSDIIGCSKGTVMSRLFHARKKLQRILEEFRPYSGVLGAEGTSVEAKSAAGAELFADLDEEGLGAGSDIMAKHEGSQSGALRNQRDAKRIVVGEV